MIHFFVPAIQEVDPQPVVAYQRAEDYRALDVTLAQATTKKNR